MAATNETFGTGISEEITNVIHKREEFWSKNPKTQADHMLINGNAAWVKLRSSVNTGGAEAKAAAAELAKIEVPTLAQIKNYVHKTFPDDAQEMVLLSGQRNAFAGGSNPGKRSGVDRTFRRDLSKAYNWDDRLGWRPMAGITSFKVASKNTYGTLRQAEVGFFLPSLKDLELASKLYFKPGFTVLLEWGHSVYINSDGNIRNTGDYHGTVNDSDFFNPSSFADIEGKVRGITKDHSYNYGGLFGYVTNFNWSLTKDGGYDCNIKIISKGSVLDSLGPGHTSQHLEGSSEKEKDKEKRKSIYHAIFNAIEEADGPEVDGQQAMQEELEPKDLGPKLRSFKAFGFDVDVAGAGWFGTPIGNEKALRYISLGTLFDIFNNFITIHDIDTKEKFISFDLDVPNKYLTFPAHFSIDPMICILPKLPSGPSHIENCRVRKKDIHQKIASFYGGADKEELIMNIMVTTHMVKTQIDQIVNSATEANLGILDIMRGILSGINTSLGNINELDIADAGDGRFTVVDRKNTIPGSTAPTLKLTGLSSTVLDINLSSTISSAIASQVSIAAQGSAGNYQDNVETLLRWNRTTVDRHFKVKAPKPEPDENSEAAKRRESFYKDLKDTWDDFNEWDADYDGEDWANIKGDSIAEIQKLAKAHINRDGIVPGVIPVELSIKMLGIEGMKIGQSFKIEPGLLPEEYNKFGYIITGLDHEIGTDNKWYTNIKTQFYSVG